MLELSLFDIGLAIILISGLIFGWKNGFVTSLGGIVGFICGIFAALFISNFVGNFLPDPLWRFGVTIFLIIIFLSLGNSLGKKVGSLFHRILPEFKPIRIIDKILGAGLSVVATGLALMICATMLGGLNVPALNAMTEKSYVLNGLDRIVPKETKNVLNSWSTQSPAYRDFSDLPNNWGSTKNSEVPQDKNLNAAQLSSSKSVVKIQGNAFSCAQSQLGSGVVVAPGRVLTNAHVVAGLKEVEVTGKTADFGTYTGNIVYFNPKKDLAVLAVDDLAASPVKLSPEVKNQEQVSFQGYPHGGPFLSGQAIVDAQPEVKNPDIYGETKNDMQVLKLAADVKPGNSGGPVIDEKGDIGGLIFASARNDQSVGYAISLDEISPIVNSASSYQSPVETGKCMAESKRNG